MKKQFFRVKQLADQTFLRADKSEVLNHEELQVADHKVEYFRNALTAISKRIPSVAGDRPEAIEKRMKKYPEYHLGSVFLEQCSRKRDPELVTRVEDDCILLQSVLKECGQAEQDLAKEQAEHEIKVEQMVSSPLQTVLDNDLPNILKQKRNLSKHILDKDSANSRYNASKNGNQKEALKDDLDEADSKVEQSRDILAAEMFNLIRKENELSQYMLQLLKLQRGYHESALKNLEKIIPELERKIGDSPVRAVFGVNLEEHLRVTGRKIAYPVELCVCALTELGMSEEGLFRVAGGTSRVKRLKLSLDSGCFKLPLIPEYRDVHVIASTLKSYLRELPEPLLTYKLYNEWMTLMTCPENQRLKLAHDILKKLPSANKDNLTYLIHFLAKLSKHPENKMNSSNIAIVVAPNLLWNSDQEKNMHMSNCTTVNLIIELFINKVDALFPNDIGSYITLTKDVLLNEEEFHRPVLQNVKLTEPETESLSNFEPTESPKPHSRRKAKPAPVPPSVTSKADAEVHNDQGHVPPSYPSGSSTLNRKIKEVKVKASVGVNTDDSLLSSSKRRSLVLETETSTHEKVDVPKSDLVSLDDKTVEHKYVSQPVASVQISKAKPVQHIVAQTFHVEAVVQNNQKPNQENIDSKPVAAPRSINNEGMLNRSSSVRTENVMSKSLNSIDGDDVQLRKPLKDDHVVRSKPEVPIRPASLRAAPRTSIDVNSELLHRTQCSVYNIHKQQPSIVNIQNRNPNAEKFQLGHDTQITEKEKFLGHQPEKAALPRHSLENKFNDINSNCSTNRIRTSSVGNMNKPETPVKMIKSNEKVNIEINEKTNGNQKPSHTRTRSDGNIIDLNDSSFQNSLLKTPPSPRSINKPTLPPPPPPTVNKIKSDADSTDL